MTEENDEIIIENFEKGKIIAAATDTVWGLLVNAEIASSIDNLYEMKERDTSKQFILFVADKSDVENYVSFIPEYAKLFMDSFWPGPLTLVLETDQKIYPQQQTTTIGVRMPNDEKMRALITATEYPVLSTSANKSNAATLSSAEAIETFFGDDVLIWQPGKPQVIDGQETMPSTVIDCRERNSWTILREGAITKEALWEVLDKIKFDEK